MKKLIFVVFLSMSISSFAQIVMIETDNWKTHNFGFGFTTTLFAGEQDLNNFYNPISELTSSDSRNELDLISTLFYSFYFEYQYQFATNWYLSTRLKLNDRGVKYLYKYYEGWTAACDVHILDLEIPIMANFKMPIGERTYWVTSLGGGLKLNISSEEPDIEKTIEFTAPTSVYRLRFDITNKKTAFVSIGTVFEFPLKNHKLQTFVSYTMYLADEYKFYNTFRYYTSGGFTDGSGNEFSQNNLEVGLTFFL